ncbi:MAG: RNA methyltransferase [Polyangiaceae bacterium]|nr:RNA methyltransferase [Polyangiaceae bacterium]
MRRRTPGAAFVADEQRKLLAALAGLDTRRIAAELADLVRPERREKLRRAIDARLRSVTIVMDAPYDPHNGAAVLRSCDAFGLATMHVVERRQSFLASKPVARGSERWVEVRTSTSAEQAITTLRNEKYTLISTHPNGELVPEDLGKIERVALILGNEREGIGHDLGLACEKSVRIPMRGFAESLNVSVTAAILLQHATSGRAGDLPQEERDLLYARALVFSFPHAAEFLYARGVLTEPLPDAAIDLLNGT